MASSAAAVAHVPAQGQLSRGRRISHEAAVEEFRELVAESASDLPEKIQGEANLFKLIEENEALCAFLIDYFKTNIAELV